MEDEITIERGGKHGKILLLLPLLAGFTSTILFFIQGGFSGGHSQFDGIIAVLGLPSILLIKAAPLPGFIIIPDLLLIIWIPTVMNMILFFSLGLTVSSLTKSK